jgi:dihydroxy-acid dehydratase
MKKPLRSNAANSPGRRAHWLALGLSDEDMEKPKIAVVNSSSELAICFSHLGGVAKLVKDAIRAAGGIPFEFHTTAPSDFIFMAGGRGAYILPSRDLVVNDIETTVEGAQLDGMVCLTSCDKTIPGHLMAAARLNIPSILVICGYQPPGKYDDKYVDIEDVFVGSVQTYFGKLSQEELRRMSEHAISGPGVCAGMATANSMHIACEALGMTLPDSAPVLADSPKMKARARESGRRIVAMIEEDLKPRDILTAGAFRNAVACVQAVSGSINCVKHLQATACEAGLDLDVYGMFNEIGARVPVLSAVRPNGRHTIGEFEDAGGARALLKQLEPLLDTGCMTVNGRTLKDNLQGVIVHNETVIRPLTSPFSPKQAISILRGNLAPESAIVRLGVRTGTTRDRFTGPAIIYEDNESAMAGLNRGEVKPGQVLILRGQGLKGGPAMAGGASLLVFAIYSANLQDDIAFVTDGQLSGLCNKGITVAEVAPESAVGGPLALVENGDMITIDIERQLLQLEVAEADLEARRARLGELQPRAARGYLGIYQRDVQPMKTGAVLVQD